MSSTTTSNNPPSRWKCIQHLHQHRERYRTQQDAQDNRKNFHTSIPFNLSGPALCELVEHRI